MLNRNQRIIVEAIKKAPAIEIRLIDRGGGPTTISASAARKDSPTTSLWRCRNTSTKTRMRGRPSLHSSNSQNKNG